MGAVRSVWGPQTPHTVVFRPPSLIFEAEVFKFCDGGGGHNIAYFTPVPPEGVTDWFSDQDPQGWGRPNDEMVAGVAPGQVDPPPPNWKKIFLRDV